MYQINKVDFGFYLRFSDLMNSEEIRNWAEDSYHVLRDRRNSFCVFVDMKDLHPLSSDSEKYMKITQILYKQKGMKRSVVIVNEQKTKDQFIQIAKNSGIYKWERYISSEENPYWEEAGMNWLLHEIDPDNN